jgi:hypothetical protein
MKFVLTDRKFGCSEKALRVGQHCSRLVCALIA